MAGVAALRREQRVFRERDSQLRDALAVDAQQLRVLFTVSRGEPARDGRIVGKAEVDDPLPPVTL